MSNATNAHALRIGTACLLAVLALLATRAPWASANAPQGDATSADADQCGPSGDVTLDTAMSEAMEQIRQTRGRAGAEAESEYVVLNNRGYNYGPPPGVRFDAHLFERESVGSAQP